MENPRVFLTGGSGFFGGALLNLLLDSGLRVRALARRTDQLAPQDSLEAVQGDLSDPSRLAEQIRGCEVVFHTAALVSTWTRDSGEFYRTNVDGLRNMITACGKAGARSLYYTSTFFALGPSGLPGAAEDSGLSSDRRHPYQHSKFLARQEAREALSSGFPIVILYPGVIYGPGKRTQGNLVAQLISDFVGGKVPGILGDGSQIWSYSFVKDVARGHLLAMQKCSSGGEYVLGGDNRSFAEFFRVVGSLVGRTAPRFRIPVSVAVALGGLELMMARLTGRIPRMIPSTARMICESWACDSRKAGEELGYAFRPLEQGLRETIEWMRVPLSAS